MEKIDLSKISLAIFDMDGTLIDSVSIWEDIDRRFFAKRGFDHVPEEYQQMIIHTGLELGAKMTIEKYNLKNDTVEGIIKEWRQDSIEQYANNIPLKEYAKEILEFLKSKGIKLALATANDKNLYEPCIKRLGIDKYFDVIVDVDKVKAGKSSPKIFNYVNDYFKLDKNATLVFEDSLMGLTTAFNDGYVTVGVDDVSSRPLENDKRKVSYCYLYSLKEFFNNLK